ncbi:hypothetical protein ABT324_13580 [Saccharopolyspora sp. NPDC000359]|uniref:hypothetical protein n=1 Tax=Saccharopolyspora sp. NPDC000359 TaxID=3154251 RepID=UPI003316FC2A
MSEQPEEPETLQGMERLDEEELGGEPIERGVQPPDSWTVETERRPTPRDEREGESLDERLAEERPDENP